MESNVFNQDCMLGLREIEDKFFDLAIVDPPYGIGISKARNIGYGTYTDWRNGKKQVNLKRRNWDKKDWDNAPPSKEYFDELKRVSKNQIIWGVNYFNYSFGSGRIVWDKVCNDKINDSVEEAYCSLHKGIRMFRFLWNGIMQGKSITQGHQQQANKKLYEERIHPTQKPVALYNWILENYGIKRCAIYEGDKILDTHMGSQSSRIAAYDMGFDYWGYEIDKDYFQAGCKRFELFKSQLKLELV